MCRRTFVLASPGLPRAAAKPARIATAGVLRFTSGAAAGCFKIQSQARRRRWRVWCAIIRSKAASSSRISAALIAASVMLENTHPFTRELWGRAWTFAHNGQLKGAKQLPATLFRPIGTTDSEAAFCWLMDQLSLAWTDYPSAAKLDAFIADLFAQLRRMGVFNALLSDGRSLYASCGKRLSMLDAPGPVRACRIARRRHASRFLRRDHAARYRHHPGDAAADARRGLGDDPPGTSLSLRGGQIAYRAQGDTAP